MAKVIAMKKQKLKKKKIKKAKIINLLSDIYFRDGKVGVCCIDVKYKIGHKVYENTLPFKDVFEAHKWKARFDDGEKISIELEVK